MGQLQSVGGVQGMAAAWMCAGQQWTWAVEVGQGSIGEVDGGGLLLPHRPERCPVSLVVAAGQAVARAGSWPRLELLLS